MKGDEIPNNQFLFRYAKPEVFPEGQDEIPNSIYNDANTSCDWEQFRKDPYDSFHIGEGRNVVIKIRVDDNIKNPRSPKRVGEIVPA